MKLYERVFERIRTGVSVLQIQQELHIPPSRLRRILNSRRLQQHLVLQRESTRAFMSLLAGDMAYWTAKHFIDLMDGRNGETTRKVCLTLLNTLIDGRHSQPLSLTALKGGKTKLPPEFLAACQSAKPSVTKRKRTIKAVPIE